MALIVGVILIVASTLAYWYALPQGGEVRRFLRNDHVQAYYSVALIVAGASGLLLTSLGLASLFN